MKTIWETRYSSSEMHYVEVTTKGVHLYLDHGKDRGDWYTFEQFEAGAANAELCMYGDEDRAQIHAAVRQMQDDPPKPFNKAAHRLERREAARQRARGQAGSD